MELRKISVLNFKNHDSFEIHNDSKVIVLVGKNGAGKTNLLDAIYYLSFCKSYFNTSDNLNIKDIADFFLIQGTYLHENGVEDTIYIGLKRNQKKIIKRNQKEYEKIADHIGLFPLVIISPNDSILITEGSEDRRKFVDGVISQYDKSYLSTLLLYQRALAQRNALLKGFYERNFFDQESVDIWNEQLIKNGKIIYKKRCEFLDRFLILFKKYYSLISSSKESVEIIYESQLNNNVDYKNAFENALPKDRVSLTTSVGIHKDDLVFTIRGLALKKFGSQGQQKTFLIALKLAQYEFIRDVCNKKPLLLLDDIYDKLDKDRISKLLEITLSDNFGQLFITHTDKDSLEPLIQQNTNSYKIIELT